MVDQQKEDMELDKTTLTHEVAKALWAVMDPFGEQAPFDEQSGIVQHNLKAQVLPVINLSIPHAEAQFKEKVTNVINTGREAGHTAEEILLAVTLELS